MTSSGGVSDKRMDQARLRRASRWRCVCACALAAACSMLATAAAGDRENAHEDAVVDVYLRALPQQVQNGAYRVLSEDAFIRRLNKIGVYFTLQRAPRLTTPAASSAAESWLLEGFQCDTESDHAGVCTNFVTSELRKPFKGAREGISATPFVFQEKATGRAERQLQFDNPTAPDPPTFTDGTVAYYGCDHSGLDQWCCAESNTGSTGPTCWDVGSTSTCTEEYSSWNQQNMICCTANLNDCVITFQPPMPVPTETPAPTTAETAVLDPTPVPIPVWTDSPPPLQIITPEPPTPEPTTAPPTQPPATTTPPPDAPTTQPPAMTTAPPTDAPTSAPITDPPTQSPVTTAPPTATPTDAPATTAPPTLPPAATPASPAPPSTAAPTSAPTTLPPAATPPSPAPPSTAAPTSAPPTQVPTTAPTAAPSSQVPATPLSFPPQTTSPPTQAPTSAPPTEAPTTLPLTQSPTTEAPTQVPTTTAPPVTSTPTQAPTSGAPTQTPTTDAQTTAAPQSPATTVPLTAAPTSSPPSQSPTTVPPAQAPIPAPVTQAPTTPPLSGVPTTAPSTQAPTTAPPSAEPQTEIPTATTPTQAPSQTPASDLPTLIPTTDSPTSPSTQVPSSLAPTQEPTTTPSAQVPTTTSPLPTSPPTQDTSTTTQEPSSTPTTQAPLTIPLTQDLTTTTPTQDPAATRSAESPTQAPSGNPTTTPQPSLDPTVVSLSSSQDPTPISSPSASAAPSTSPFAEATTSNPSSTPAAPTQDPTVDSSTASQTSAPASEASTAATLAESPTPTDFLSTVLPSDETTARLGSTSQPETTPQTSSKSPATATTASAALQISTESKKKVVSSRDSVLKQVISDTIPPQRDEDKKNDSSSVIGSDEDAVFQKTLADFTESTTAMRDTASKSANVLVATAVAVNVVSGAITVITAIASGASAVSGTASGVSAGLTASQGLLNGIGGSASVVQQGIPSADLSSLLMMLNYLQFLASGSHMSLPGAPDFFFEFTDSLGWSNFQLPSALSDSANVTDGKQALSSANAGDFSVADGDIISGVLAYAERVNIKPEELFTKTAIAFASVVGSVAAVVASLYTVLRCVAKRRLEMVVQRLNDLPRAKLLMRLLIQSCLSICLMSEYALSMTSSFQLRYNHHHQGNYSALAFATVALIVICFGLIVLGVIKIWNKTEEELSDPDFKFAWGAYYKYYHFHNRYFFVAKMGAEILSGVIIGLVSDVPSQLTLLMSLQLAMFFYAVESAPYSMDFQTVCSSTAFVMKMLTYALISSFLTASTEVTLRDFVGTLVIFLQVTLLLLFNSRQLYILYKQMKYMWSLRQERLRAEKESKMMEESAMLVRTSMSALTPKYEATPASFGLLHSKNNFMVTTPSQPPSHPIAAA